MSTNITDAPENIQAISAEDPALKGRPFALKHPCAECPFSRECTPGFLGSSDPTVFIGQAQGPFMLPCHMQEGYSAKTANQNAHVLPQCAGAAIYRSNIGVSHLMPPQVHRLPPGHPKVFGTPAELLSHHKRVALESAQAFLNFFTPERLLLLEFSKIDSRHIIRQRTE